MRYPFLLSNKSMHKTAFRISVAMKTEAIRFANRAFSINIDLYRALSFYCFYSTDNPLKARDLTQAAKYERTESRQGYRSSHYDTNLTTTSGNVTVKVPKLQRQSLRRRYH
jgi:hypothetical protein